MTKLTSMNTQVSTELELNLSLLHERFKKLYVWGVGSGSKTYWFIHPQKNHFPVHGEPLFCSVKAELDSNVN